ncbi:S41 family peptidase [Pedobacter cryoconitis]|uniref:Peptidase S41-like protein n=1 Tax=Pedobacter cryoconitis TaxID=188932 RepID=A0A327SDA0_9SPHI|nr:S41 family peptidase [Pedobacter cryoconitis]RAJ26352.1 peptidase S41-like protein [Pedobacter cryoconitis]
MLQKLALSILLFTLLNTNKVTAQSFKSQEVKIILDTTILLMKKNSIHANQVNWNKLKKEAYTKAIQLNSPYELGPAIRSLYQSINDFHGEFFYRDSTFRWKRSPLIISDSIKKELKKGVKPKIELLAGNIGYLRIPPMSGTSVAEFSKKAQGLNDSLCLLLTKGIKGIILDLRLNGGGAMFPMILGVEQLLPKGHLGSFQDQTKEEWFIKDHQFFTDTTMLSSITPQCSITAEKIPVVILTGPATGSSGEFFIIAFKGRKNTILLGAETAGYVTANSGFTINKFTSFNLSTGYGVDSNGKVYKEALQPDILNKSMDNFNNINSDEKINAAISWLKVNFN